MSQNFCLKKLKSFRQEDSPRVIYELDLGDGGSLCLNHLIQKIISFSFTGNIFCSGCGRKIKKSFNQGYCYPCFINLPQNDICQVKPEKCHFSAGTCRDEHWGKEHCFIDHTLYASFTSDLKVGITRSYQRINRWIDQGALVAIPLGRFENRLQVGLVEAHLAGFFRDKTSWQKMLKISTYDHTEFLERVLKIKDILKDKFSIEDCGEPAFTFHYPLEHVPPKLLSLTPEKNAFISGNLLGIKGQYLIFEHGVFNIRRASGYEVSLGIQN